MFWMTFLGKQLCSSSLSKINSPIQQIGWNSRNKNSDLFVLSNKDNSVFIDKHDTLGELPFPLLIVNFDQHMFTLRLTMEFIEKNFEWIYILRKREWKPSSIGGMGSSLCLARGSTEVTSPHLLVFSLKCHLPSQLFKWLQ